MKRVTLERLKADVKREAFRVYGAINCEGAPYNFELWRVYVRAGDGVLLEIVHPQARVAWQAAYDALVGMPTREAP